LGIKVRSGEVTEESSETRKVSNSFFTSSCSAYRLEHRKWISLLGRINLKGLELSVDGEKEPLTLEVLMFNFSLGISFFGNVGDREFDSSVISDEEVIMVELSSETGRLSPCCVRVSIA
jgi:hypothetical protein